MSVQNHIINTKKGGLQMKSEKIHIPKLKKRVEWGFNPTTRVVKNKKAYSRSRYKNQTARDLSI